MPNITKLSNSGLLEHFNLFYLYWDFTIKSFNFHTQYGLSLFDSGCKAMKSISDFQKENGKKIQDKFRYTFDNELKNMLKKTNFPSIQITGDLK